MIEYRLCEVGELDKLSSLLYNIDGSFPIPLSKKTDLKHYGQKLLDKGAVYGAWDKESMVGMCGFYANDTVNHKAYIAVLGIAAEYQHQGIAKHLLNETIAYCSSQKMKQCYLFTHKTNSGAIALYKGLGFSEAFDADRPDDIMFIKNLF